MEASQIYILISIVVLLIIAILLFFVAKKRKEERKPTKLAWFAFAFIIAGIIFGDSRLIGYSLMGIGILLAVIDIFNKHKKK
ncbi:MAG: hypothetical protein PHT54_04240 [Candidatus Nanoarchaeia archaeon]|nr:hypothetical protein [Candidatus Nanoarchaeia archaeon]